MMRLTVLLDLLYRGIIRPAGGDASDCRWVSDILDGLI